jgi:transcriptional regulator with XRE-family HTH domain
MRKKNPLLVSIGGRLRELRTERGFSQEGLALEAELDRTYIGGVERGERNISLVNLKRLCDALDINLSQFFSTQK